MTLTVKLGAKADGTLTAFQVRNVSNTGAYGNHGGETLFAGGAAVIDLPLPQQEVRRVLRLHQHRAERRAARVRHDAAGVRRGVGDARAGARAATWIPSNCGGATSCGPATRSSPCDDGPDDVAFTEDGLAKCIDLVDDAMARTADEPSPGAGLARRDRRRELAARDRAPDRAHLRGLGHARRRPHVRAGRRHRRIRRGHVDRARPDRGQPAGHDAVADPPGAVRHRPHGIRHRRLRERGPVRRRATRCCGRPTPCATASWSSPPRTRASTR